VSKPRESSRPTIARARVKATATPAAMPLSFAQGKGTRGLSTDAVHERIWSAIVDHSLPPDTRLIESELCEIFSLGRTRMRQVLQRLAHEHVVTLLRNRGAAVSKPTPHEARQVFAARRILEAGIVQTLLSRSGKVDLRPLREHLRLEEDAWRTGDRRAMLKLSGEFHLRVAKITGNVILCDLLRDLISRSSLIIAVYQSPTTRPCPPDAHRELLRQLEEQDPVAVESMVQHLDHVITGLNLDDRRSSGVDLRSIFTSLEPSAQ
jgi:DNA-binding GntR family transcriptional regulator